MADEEPISVEIARAIDSALEQLRWCRQHVQDRAVTFKLRELEQTIGALALALDYEMEGDTNRAEVSMDHAVWRQKPIKRAYADLMYMYDHMYDH